MKHKWATLVTMQSEIQHQNSQNFYPSEPFTLDHSDMRHPAVTQNDMFKRPWPISSTQFCLMQQDFSKSSWFENYDQNQKKYCSYKQEKSLNNTLWNILFLKMIICFLFSTIIFSNVNNPFYNQVQVKHFKKYKSSDPQSPALYL